MNLLAGVIWIKYVKRLSRKSIPWLGFISLQMLFLKMCVLPFFLGIVNIFFIKKTWNIWINQFHEMIFGILSIKTNNSYKEQSILKCLQYSEADSENFHSTFCGPFKMSFLSKLAEYAFLKLDLFHRYYG